jgi:hypothetical protein
LILGDDIQFAQTLSAKSCPAMSLSAMNAMIQLNVVALHRLYAAEQ